MLGSLERLEDCIAEAAYLNIYDDDVDRAVEVMLEMGSNVDRVFDPILQSLRAGSKSDLESALLECKRLGWEHSFIHESSPSIYEERNRVVQEEVAKHKLLAMSSDIKNGYEVKTIEVMQLLRGITSMGLNQNPGSLLTFALRSICGCTLTFALVSCSLTASYSAPG